MESKLDYKKEYADLYMPKGGAKLVTVPPISFVMADGTGDPNDNPQFETAVSLLYGITFTIKMSKKSTHRLPGYFEYVVPPLEGLWRIDGGVFSLEERGNWQWTLMIRQPDFVDADAYEWAHGELLGKKPELAEAAQAAGLRFERFDEGACVQMMHKGPYATEPATVKAIADYIAENGLYDLVADGVPHHEIYLSDPRRGKPENMKTVLRHPVRPLKTES